MGREIKLTIHGNPVAQGRPRFSSRGGFARAYDPRRSREYKELVATSAKGQLQGQDPLAGALTMSVRVYREMPKGFGKRKQEQAESGEVRPITKPDTDNYVKGITDALNGICWEDDAQIVAYHEPFGKYYSQKLRIEIEVCEL